MPKMAAVLLCEPVLVMYQQLTRCLLVPTGDALNRGKILQRSAITMFSMDLVLSLKSSGLLLFKTQLFMSITTEMEL